MNAPQLDSSRRPFSVRGLPALALGILASSLAYCPLTSAQVEKLPPSPPPPASPDPPKAPVPDAAAQREAEKLIRELFKADYAKRAPTDVQVLAAKLLQQGRETKDDPAGQFVLLQQARELAVQAGDLATALAAVEETGKAYAVDSLTLKVQALAAALLPAGRPEAIGALAESCLETIDEALAADRLEAAAELAGKAETAARAAKDAALLKRAQHRKKEIEAAKREGELARAAEQTLGTNPDDPAANLAAGRYAAWVKGNWEKGAARLAKGSDAALKAAAEKELAKPSGPPGQAAAGDAWWEAAEKARGQACEERWRGRARHWYETALPGLTGITKIKVEKRLEHTVASPVETPIASGLVGYWNFNGPLPQIPDLSPRKNHGTPHGGVKQVPGVSGGALAFDGVDDYVALGASGIPPTDAPKTIALWLRLATGAERGQNIISLTNQPVTGTVEVGCRQGKIAVFKLGSEILVSAAPPERDTWRHYAYTFDGKTHRLYVDGTLKDSSIDSNNRVAVMTVELGRIAGWGQYYAGCLDEVRIYDRAISEAEVQNLVRARR
jgi:hypothetical protein